MPSNGVSIDAAFSLGEASNQTLKSSSAYSNLGTFLSDTILPNVLVIAGVILFFLILFGGFTIITGAGNPDSQKKGGQILTISLIGFLLVFLCILDYAGFRNYYRVRFAKQPCLSIQYLYGYFITYP